ncbi:MAG: hypothetical protein AAF531_03320 [Actinomycetota bacterium]
MTGRRADDRRDPGCPPVATIVVRLFGGGLGNPGSLGLGLHPDLRISADAKIVTSRLDGFSNPELERLR